MTHGKFTVVSLLQQESRHHHQQLQHNSKFLLLQPVILFFLFYFNTDRQKLRRLLFDLSNIINITDIDKIVMWVCKRSHIIRREEEVIACNLLIIIKSEE